MLKALQQRQRTGKGGFLLDSLRQIQFITGTGLDDPNVTEEMIYEAMDKTIMIGKQFYDVYVVRDHTKTFDK